MREARASQTLGGFGKFLASEWPKTSPLCPEVALYIRVKHVSLVR